MIVMSNSAPPGAGPKCGPGRPGSGASVRCVPRAATSEHIYVLCDSITADCAAPWPQREFGRNSKWMWRPRHEKLPDQNAAGTLTFWMTLPDLSTICSSTLRRPRGPETRPVAVSWGSEATWNCGNESSAARSSVASSVASSGCVPGPGCRASTPIFTGREVRVSPSSMIPPGSRLTRPLQPLRDQLPSRKYPLRESCSVTSSRPETSKNSPLNGSPESKEQEAVPFGSALTILPVSLGNRSATERATACAPSFTWAASKSPSTSAEADDCDAPPADGPASLSASLRASCFEPASICSSEPTLSVSEKATCALVESSARSESE